MNDDFYACPICGHRTQGVVCDQCFDWVWDRSIEDAQRLHTCPDILAAYVRKYERQHAEV